MNLRIKKPSVSKNGYFLMCFSRAGNKPVTLYLHRLVVEAFLGDVPNNLEVSHLDGDKRNNAFCNLTVESHKENANRRKQHGTEIFGARNPSVKLTEQDVLMMRQLRVCGANLKELGAMFNVSFQQVSRVCRGENWRERYKGGNEDLKKASWYLTKISEE